MKTGGNSTQLQVRKLLARIASVRQKRKLVRLTTGCAFAVAVLVSAFTAEMILDCLVELPWIARAFALAGAFGGAFFWLWRDAIRPLRRRVSDDGIASMIESAMPVFRTRFIASVQLARTAGEAFSNSLIRALIVQTAAMVGGLDFRQVVKTARMKRALRCAVLAFVVVFGLAAYEGEGSLPLIKRALLFNTPLPHMTHILNVTGDLKIGIGEDVRIEVTASGILPPNGRIIATGANKQHREFALEHDPAHQNKYSTLIRSPQDSFTYYVKLNDDTSQTYSVSTLLRPSVVEVECEQTYPPYINLPPIARSPGDLALLVGSRLKVRVKANVGIGKAALRLEGLNMELALQINPKDPTRLSGEIEIPPKDLTGFSVRMVSRDGVASGEGAVYRIDLTPDRAPAVRITYPRRREELATAQATALMAFEAKDDFGVVKATLHYTIDAGEEKTLDFNLGGERNVKHQFPWKLTALQPPLTVGNVVEFWWTVSDANNLTGPGIGTSEHNQIKIVTDDDKRLDIQNRLRDVSSGFIDVKNTADVLNKELGDVIFQKSNGNQ